RLRVFLLVSSQHCSTKQKAGHNVVVLFAILCRRVSGGALPAITESYRYTHCHNVNSDKDYFRHERSLRRNVPLDQSSIPASTQPP
ncbi:hypothetical protein GGR57DRAFT_469085, partial [Xylariaceae sp. FL1272]